jgi:hypothetical protein
MIFLYLSIEPYGVPIQIKGNILSKSYPEFIGPELKQKIFEWNNVGTIFLARSDLLSFSEAALEEERIDFNGRMLSAEIELLHPGTSVEYVSVSGHSLEQ